MKRSLVLLLFFQLFNLNLLTGQCSNPVEYNDPNSQDGILDSHNIPCAWTISMGTGDFPVAVTDCYFDDAHDEIAGKVLYYPPPSCLNGDPSFHHGIQSFGAIVAEVNNNDCIAGVAPNTTVAGYKPASNTELDKISDDGFKIVSISTWYSATRSTLEQLTNNGVTVVWASPGGDSNPDTHLDYHDVPGVIIVGRAYQNGSHWNYVNGGDRNMDILFITNQLNRIEEGNGCGFAGGGTSIGTPHVAGVVNLMKSVNPCLFPGDIEEILVTTAAPSSQPSVHRGGIIDAYAAVQMAQNFTGFDQNWEGVETITYAAVSGDLFIKDNAVITLTGELKVADESNIIVETGARLIVEGQISLGDLSQIRVERGAILELNGATLTTQDCANQWEGIIVEGNTKFPQQYQPTDPFRNGIVQIYGDTYIENAKKALSTNPSYKSWPDVTNYYGGLIMCYHSTFDNNIKVAEFMKYRHEDKSFFHDNVFSNQDIVTTHWSNHGVDYSNNEFNSYEKHAILGIDAGVNVTYGNVFNSTLQTSFEQSAIDLIGSGTASGYSSKIGSLLGEPNYFYGGYTSIFLDGSNPINKNIIQNNVFLGGEYGVRIDGTSNYELASNDFAGIWVGTGISSTTGNNSLNTQYQNNFNSCMWGIYSFFNNSNYTFESNCFDNTGDKDMSYTGQGPNIGVIYSDIGSDILSASNTFSTPSFTRGIYTSSSIISNYHIRENTPTSSRLVPLNFPGNIFDSDSNNDLQCGSANPPEGVFNPIDECNIPLDPAQKEIFIEQLKQELEIKHTTLETLQEFSAQWWTLKHEIIKLEFCLNKALDFFLKTSNCDSLALHTSDWQRIPLSSKNRILSALFENNCCSVLDILQRDTSLNRNQEEIDFISTTQMRYEYVCNDSIPNFSQLDTLRAIGDRKNPTSGQARGFLRLITGERMWWDFPLQSTRQRSITSSKKKNNFEIAPNPIVDKALITFEETPKNISLNVYNSMGNLIDKPIQVTGNAQSIDFSNFPAGSYIILVRDKNTDELIGSKKIIKL